MKNSLIIYVTARDIALGAPFDCRLCPVARAVKRRLPYRVVEVSTEGVFVGVCSLPIVLARPGLVSDFVRRFDTPALRHDLRPFRFRLTPP